MIKNILHRSTFDGNMNGIIIGSLGSGTHFIVEKEIDVLIKSNIQVLVIDPFGDYRDMCNNFGGTCHKLAIKDLPLRIPFLDGKEDEGRAGDFVVAAITMMYKYINLLQKAAIYSYIDKERPDYFTDVLEYIFTDNTIFDAEFKKAFTYYQNLWNDSKKTEEYGNNGALTVFECYETGSNALAEFWYLFILKHCLYLANKNWEKGKKTMIYLSYPEILTRTDKTQNFLSYMVKKGRLNGYGITCVTKFLASFVHELQTVSLIANAPHICLLRQSPTDADILKNVLNLSDNQIRFLLSVRAGDGIIIDNRGEVKYTVTDK